MNEEPTIRIHIGWLRILKEVQIEQLKREIKIPPTSVEIVDFINNVIERLEVKDEHM